MIAIAVCDDSEAVVASLSGLIEHYAKETSQDIKIYKYDSGLQLLDKYTGNYDIIFLDIKMPHIDGLETAKGIRKRDRSVSIIFLTSMVQYALEGYKVEALNYIVKPISYKRLKMELDAWFQKRVQETPSLVIKNNDGSFRIQLKEMIYIETSNRNVLVHTKNENLICHKKLKVLESELGSHGFSRCHSAYIVNLAYIKSIEQMDVRLITGEVIPISQTKKKSFMQSFARYYGERI